MYLSKVRTDDIPTSLPKRHFMKFAMDVYIQKNSTHIYFRGIWEEITSFTLLPFQTLGKVTDWVNRAGDLNGVQITMFYTRSFTPGTVALQTGKYRLTEFTYIH